MIKDFHAQTAQFITEHHDPNGPPIKPFVYRTDRHNTRYSAMFTTPERNELMLYIDDLPWATLLVRRNTFAHVNQLITLRKLREKLQRKANSYTYKRCAKYQDLHRQYYNLCIVFDQTRAQIPDLEILDWPAQLT